ncbi:alpha/beta fold hydrolase [Actinoplanes sp. NPDC049316]|uniref:alpha/beta fold hydrolase n=1 Tax=Actinoplanes sp. NPDC049316 TaxID=3154727 RepID=UPI0034175C05
MPLRPAALGSVVSALLLTLPAVPASAAGSIRWTPCDDGFRCGTMSVPLSYDDPRGERISIALTRLPATDPRHRIGSLVVNPGGPGLSGIDFARTYLRDLPADLRARFDIVNFDSRGLGSSTALRCYDSAAEEQADRAPFLYPDTPAEEEIWRQADDKLAAACARCGGPILNHMSTADVARDLDVLRVRLADRKLTYLGYSYGSLLGQTYANLFPDGFRALVVDGVIDYLRTVRTPGPGTVCQPDPPFPAPGASR